MLGSGSHTGVATMIKPSLHLLLMCWIGLAFNAQAAEPDWSAYKTLLAH